MIEKWVLEQGRLAEVDLVEAQFNFNTLERDYEPVATKIIDPEHTINPGYGDKLSFKCARCGRIYVTHQAAFRHSKSHTSEARKEDEELL